MKQRTIFIGILLFILVNIVYSQPNRVLIVTGGKTVDK
jgi:hypothetical protein